MRTTNYSAFLARTAGLIGVATSALQAEEKTILNGFFNHAIKTAWESSNWLDLTRRGEARFAGNLIQYANAYTANGSAWASLGVTATDNVLANPLDARLTAASLFETGAVSVHDFTTPALTLIPANQYNFVVYVRPAGREFVQLRVTDNAGTYSAFLQVSGPGAVVSESGCVASVGQVADGFYKCAITFTSASVTPVSAVAALALSPDGVTTNYPGVLGTGVFMWGWWLGLSTATPNNQTIAWDQTGETFIEAIFTVWKNPLNAARNPDALPYYLTTEGIQLVGPGSGPPTGGPVYLDYRPPVPLYEGGEWNPLATYAINEQVNFTDAANVTNFFKALAATVAGESPATAPAKWEVIPVPAVFLNFCVYNSYAQWLRVEGRNGAAEIAEGRADDELTDEFDRQERQMGAVLRTQYQTHVSVQPR